MGKGLRLLSGEWGEGSVGTEHAAQAQELRANPWNSYKSSFMQCYNTHTHHAYTYMHTYMKTNTHVHIQISIHIYCTQYDVRFVTDINIESPRTGLPRWGLGCGGVGRPFSMHSREGPAPNG